MSPENLNVSQDKVKGNIKIQGKQTSLFPKGLACVTDTSYCGSLVSAKYIIEHKSLLKTLDEEIEHHKLRLKSFSVLIGYCQDSHRACKRLLKIYRGVKKYRQITAENYADLHVHYMPDSQTFKPLYSAYSRHNNPA